MVPDRQDWPVLVQKYNQGNYDAIALGYSSSPESDPYQTFHSSQIENQGDNRSHYINHELDKLIEQARATVDRDARLKLWHGVHRILHEDQPYTFLSHRKELWVMNNRIANREARHDRVELREHEPEHDSLVRAQSATEVHAVTFP